MKQARMLFSWMAGSLLCSAAVFAATPPPANDVVQVFELENRTPDELIPVIAPMVPHTSLKGFNGQLIVKGDANSIETVKNLLLSLDKAAKNLHIMLKQLRASSVDPNSFAKCGSIQSQSIAFSLQCSDSSQVDETIRTLRDNDVLSQDVRVLSGEVAQIKSGFEMPYVVAAQINPTGSSHHQPQSNQNIGSGIAYKPIISGFFVQATLMKNDVRIRISSDNQQLSQDNGGQVNAQSMVTELRVPLDTWVNIAGTNNADSSNDDAITYQTQRSKNGETSVWLKVEVLGGER